MVVPKQNLEKSTSQAGPLQIFLKRVKPTVQDVLNQIGEPFGYQERKNRSALIYLNFNEDYVNLLFTEIRTE